MRHIVETKSYKAGYGTGSPNGYDNIYSAQFDTEEEALCWLFGRVHYESNARIEVWLEQALPKAPGRLFAEYENIMTAVRWRNQWSLRS